MPLPILHLDFETRSVLDVSNVGPHVYASHESTEVIAMAWSVQRGKKYSPVETWNFDEDEFVRLVQPLRGDFIIAAHNAAFERNIWNVTLKPFGFKYQPIDRFRCSMARAAMLGLPQSLERLAYALRLPVQKDMEGNKLMRQLAQPITTIRDENLFGESGPIFDNDPEKHRRNAEYCATDVRTEIAADKTMGPMPESELKVWLLDQKINQRGIRVDRTLCKSIINIVDACMERRGRSLSDLTGGVVTSATQPERIKDWLRHKGMFVDGLGADIVEKLLADELPDDDGLRTVRQVLEIRRDTAKSSTAKCARMIERSAIDGRMRDNLRYHGAFTGRWSGSGAQIQNYPRGSFNINPHDETTYDELVAKSFVDGEDSVALFFGDPVDVAKSMLRGCLTASPGKKLLVWDYGQIEARGLPWIAGEQWKIEAFREIDNDPNQPDVYERSFAKSFGVDPWSVEKWQRQIGKVCELALGYQGGPGAFVSMAKIYRVEISDYIDILRKQFPDVASKAREDFDRRGRESGIDRTTWIAAEICKLNWRKEHPATVALWYGLEDAAIKAVEEGSARYGRIRFQMVDRYLKMIMPSGHVISYFRPSIDDSGWKPQLAYWREHNRQMVRTTTYGGKIAQNATESVARSAMVDGMLRMDDFGFDIIGTVHDEIISECDWPYAEGALRKGKILMEQNSPWSIGLPLVANGEIMNRYRK